MRFGLWHEREPLLLHYCIFVGDFFTIGMTAFLFPFFISFSCLPTTECPSPFNPSSRKSQLRNIVLFSFVTRNLLAYRSLKFTVFCKRSSKEALISWTVYSWYYCSKENNTGRIWRVREKRTCERFDRAQKSWLIQWNGMFFDKYSELLNEFALQLTRDMPRVLSIFSWKFE